jgi:hypothetical protein
MDVAIVWNIHRDIRCFHEKNNIKDNHLIKRDKKNETWNKGN